MTDVSWAFNTQLMRNECHANVYTKAQRDARVRKNDIAQRYLRAAKLWNQAFRASTLEPSFTQGLFLFSTTCPAGWSHSLPDINHRIPPPTFSYLPQPLPWAMGLIFQLPSRHCQLPYTSNARWTFPGPSLIFILWTTPFPISRNEGLFSAVVWSEASGLSNKSMLRS